jgi:two-component SAPR family response regulator
MLPPILGTRKRVPFSLQRKRGGKMNIRTTVYKLQKALLMQGRKIKINQIQAYSQKVGKMITKYIVIESRELEDGRTKNETLLETYSMVDIAKLLALLYRGDDA